MSDVHVLYEKPGAPQTYALLRRLDDFGVESLELIGPPRRFWADGEPSPAQVEMAIDARTVKEVLTPAELLSTLPSDSWTAMTKRSLARLASWFLLVEDPQRRLEVQAVATLAHQASVVQHILTQPSLRRVLLADEVGLGKTIEAGLIIKDLLTRNKGARVLYLAPARLVHNVRRELDKLDLGFRSWVATGDRDATLKDARVVASIHRASHKGQLDDVVKSAPWDMIVADECHHLSDWAAGGGNPVAQYKLVERLAGGLGEDGRLLLMSGTPHQGHADRFKNLLNLLKRKNESEAQLAGRVIYRTKEDVRDWDDQPLFPGRRVNSPYVIDLGPEHRSWLSAIHELFEPGSTSGGKTAERRAAGWRAGQALQWATSSVQAGLGYLIRQAIRAKCKPASLAGLRDALAAVRPYRLGAVNESVEQLFERIRGEVEEQIAEAVVEDIEDLDDDEDDGKWRPNLVLLGRLLADGVRLLRATGDAKWDFLFDRILEPAGDEKVVLFAQPIETVTTVVAWLERKTGRRPALIVGGQSEAARTEQIEQFWKPAGPRFLVSSRAGGEGLNLQVARRLVHLDVPWNPMELEQRIGRVHRFGSRRTVIIDTLVVKDSREVDTYACAREKLRTIAQTMVTEDRFDALFGRVMSLVPPEELQDIFGRGALGPLDDAERAAVAALVTRGYEQWKKFDVRYSEQQRSIRALDPGQASFGDLGAFAAAYLGAAPADGFSALQFLWQEQEGEVVSAARKAEVLSIDDQPWACGDNGGMPVTRDDGTQAKALGSNVGIVARALRAHGLPAAGAAHVRWPDGAEPRPHEGPFGVIVVVRQSMRWENGTYVEHGATLRCTTVTASGQTSPVSGHAKGALVRALARATVRRDPENAPALIAAMKGAEASIVGELRRPSDEDRETRVVHAVTPLLAAVVS